MPESKIIYILFLFLIAGCNSSRENSDTPIASVSGEILYNSDLGYMIPDNISKADSTLMAEDYIRKWIKTKLLIRKAKENLTEDQMDVSKELEEYRHSLITYRYKKELMRQKMDIDVSDEEIEEYYSNNTDHFLLKDNIVKAIFIKIPNEVAKPELLKLYCEDQSEAGINELKDYCVQYAKIFDMFDGDWVEFDRVLKHIPKEIDNHQRFLTRNKIIEFNDDDYFYFAYFNDYRFIGQPAPIEHVKGHIKNLILNKRKIDFLKNIENEIYEDGVRTKKFKIYN